MSFSTTGTNPILNLDFGGIEFGSCTLFFKNKSSSSFRNLTTVNNKTFKRHSLTLDPVNLIRSGASLADLLGCQIGWTVTFVNLGSGGTIIFSFDLDIQQSGTTIMSPSFRKDNASGGLVVSSTSVIFNGTFTF